MMFEKKKIFIIVGLVGVYLVFAALFQVLLAQGIIDHAPPAAQADSTATDTTVEMKMAPTLIAAQSFFERNLQNKGHIDLYYLLNSSQTFAYQNYTNSEAVSYYLLWTANDNQKSAFDAELDYIEKNMIHKKGYLMWRLSPEDKPTSDGANIATDADLRTIHALLIAEKQWGDTRYTKRIDSLAQALEHIAITNDTLLAPYGGYSGETIWRTNEVWLSYADFTTIDALAKRRGEPWRSLYTNMKNATLNAQIANGLYNSMLTQNRAYGTGIDNDGYSINSLWIMVRSAESGDPQLMASATKSLAFYKKAFASEDNTIYTSYSSSGDSLTSYDSPWVYALVARAAIALGDKDASQAFVSKLATFQVTDNESILYGSFPEGMGDVPRVGQFTMQESILTLQAYIQKYDEVKP